MWPHAVDDAHRGARAREWPAGVNPVRPAAMELFVSKEDFKFSAAHFICHERRRELLHGHNYRVALTINGSVGDECVRADIMAVRRATTAALRARGCGRWRARLPPRTHARTHALRRARDTSRALPASSAPDRPAPRSGYVVDFGEVKKAMRRICAELDEHFLLPERNPFLTVTTAADGNVDIVTRAGDRFSLPAGDVHRLPVSNVSVEELARHICRRFVDAVTAEALRRHAVVAITVGVTETANQEARFSVDIAPAPAPAAAEPDGGSAPHATATAAVVAASASVADLEAATAAAGSAGGAGASGAGPAADSGAGSADVTAPGGSPHGAAPPVAAAAPAAATSAGATSPQRLLGPGGATSPRQGGATFGAGHAQQQRVSASDADDASADIV